MSESEDEREGSTAMKVLHIIVAVVCSILAPLFIVQGNTLVALLSGTAGVIAVFNVYQGNY